MKRLLAVLVSLGLLVAPSRASAQQIPVGPGSDLSSLVGLPIDVPFVADLSARTERLGSFAIRIQWDVTKLQVTWLANTSFGSAQVNPDSLAVGVARIAGVNPAGATGRVTLATARITPLVNGTTTLQVSLTELYAAGTFADLLPNAVVASGTYCPARGRWGDIDGDGNANSRDALLALSSAVGLDVSAFDISLGDVDGSGTTNARDALIILSNAVGVDVSAFRVLRLAGGACAANAGRALTIVPGGLDTLPLVVGQTVLLEARAGDSAGVLQAITDVTWASSRSGVLWVQADGSAVARDTGTAVVTVRRGATDSAQTTVHVVARRRTHWVDARAAGATNRLGTPALPFGTLNEGVHFAQAGDTVRVRVGVYDLTRDGDGGLTISRPIVLLGDVAADSSRPAIAGPPGQDGVDLNGPGSVEIHNFDITGFGTAFIVEGPSCVLLRGVRVRQVGYGMSVEAHTGCVRIERSQMIGQGPAGEGWNGGPAVAARAAVDILTIEDSEIADFDYGVYDETMYVDSLTIRRSLLHDVGSAALYLSAYCEQCARSSQAVVIDGSRLARTRSGSYLVYLSTTLRGGTFAHSTFTNPSSDVLYVESTGSGYLSLAGDSIIAPPDQQSSRWLAAERLDSLVLDSVAATGFYDSYVGYTPRVRVANSTFRDVRSYAFQVYPYGSGGVLSLDTVAIYGDPRDDLAASGVYLGGTRATINRLTGVNLYDGVYASSSDSGVTVTNSMFQHVQYPLYWSSYSAVAPESNGLTVRGTTFRGFSTAVEAYEGTLVADSNVFVNGYTAVDASSPKPMTATRNQISGTEYGLDLVSHDSSTVVTVSDNSVSGTTSTAISVSGTAYQDLQTVLDARRNTVTCTGAASTSVTGIELSDAHILALNNTVDGCYAGLVTSQGGGQVRNDTILGNTITVPPSGQVGIGVTGIVSARVAHNTVTGAATGLQEYGLIDVASCPNYGNCPDEYIPTVVIDSNRVTGGTVWGIHAEDVDSLDIVANQVENLNNASIAYGYYNEEFGAVSVLRYISTFARILGNIVRHIHGNGIVVGHSGGTTLSVDSNVVADIDSSGLTYQPGFNSGSATITRNLFTGARREGILVNAYYNSPVVTDNNIADNPGYGVRAIYTEVRVDATNNWWGDPAGPTRCPEGCFSAGDSVDYYSVNWSPFRTARNDSVPPLPIEGAPRFMAQAHGAPPVRAAVSTGRLDAAIAGGDRLHAPKTRPIPPSAAPRSVLASRPAAAQGGPFAERRAAEERDRAAFEAHRAERLQQLRERVAARLRADELIRARRASSSHAPRSQRVRP